MATSGLLKLAIGALAAATIAVGLPSTPALAAPPLKMPLKTPHNPDADYMGSTIAAHEPDAAARMSVNAIGPTGVPGIDVSHWQGVMNWNAVAASGTKWAYIKATEGKDWTDDQFWNNANGSYNAGLIRGAYHFALPDVSSGTQQADWFVANGAAWTPEGHTLPPVLDIEYSRDPNDWCYHMTPSQMVAWVEEFVNRMHARIGRWPIIYTTRGWWRQCTGNYPGLGTRTALWIAGYKGDPNTLPNGWAGHTMWQYSSTTIDQDVFNGDLNELSALAIGDEPAMMNAHYNRLGGAAYAGDPTGARYSVGDGTAQDYTNGTLYFTPGSGARALRGEVLAYYRQNGGPTGFLGFPGFDDTVPPDGVGRFSHFQGGSVYWSPATNAHEVHGAIRDTWASLGWEGFLGYPTTDESAMPDGVGRVSTFQRGSIYFTPATGAHELYGSIYDTWASLGKERSYLGYPTSGEWGTPDGLGRANVFQRGVVYWTEGTGAHEVQGSIYNTWASLGWERSYLGYPTSGEWGTPDGLGRANVFQRGVVYWTQGTGAHEVQGSIYDAWASLGWERSALGYPTSGEFSIPGGRQSNFQHGSITWTAATGAVTVTYT